MGSGNGAWYVQGLQKALPGGNSTTLGPFAVAFGPAQSVQSEQVTGGGMFEFSPPTDPPATGLWIIPSDPTMATILFQGAGATDVGIFLNPSSPSFINFDPDNYPTQIVLTITGDLTISIQYT